MSHFTVLVIGDNPEQQLAPFHEFECTGLEQFIQEIDVTEEYLKDYNEDSHKKLIDSDGNIYCPYDDRFYRDPLPTENVGIGYGISNGVSFSSKDWGDGKGYRPKVRFTPEGFTEKEIPVKQTMSFRSFIEDYHEFCVVTFGLKPAVSSHHKYRYATEKLNGEIDKIIKRTNPDSKWDWYQLGGRWTGFLTLKEGCKGEVGELGLFGTPAKKGEADSALKKNIELSELTATFAVVKDSKWYEKGEMGWWACVSNKKDDNDWEDEFKKLLDSVSDDTLLSVYDCHI